MDNNSIALKALEDSLAKEGLSDRCRQILETRRKVIKKRIKLQRRLVTARQVRSQQRQQRRQEMLQIIEQLRSRGMQWSKISARLAKKGFLGHGGMPYNAKTLMNLYSKRERE